MKILKSNMLKRSLLIFFLLALISCKDKPPTQPPPATPSVTGTWQGSGTKSGIAYTVTVALVQTTGDTIITGNGEIAALFARIPFSVTGGNNYPDVRLKFTNPDPTFGTGTYSGQFDMANDNVINGMATVPAFGITNEPLKIERIK